MVELHNIEINVLLEDYRRTYKTILEFAKLQYQLVGVAYTIAGAALTFWGNSGDKLLPIALLYLPPIFCGLVAVQLYLHSQIKGCARYINFRLRPRVEQLLNNIGKNSNNHPILSWEEYYVETHKKLKFLTRQLGSIIIMSVYLLAIGPMIIFIQQTNWSNQDYLWFIFDSAIVIFTLILFFFIKFVNEMWWKDEEKSMINDELIN